MRWSLEQASTNTIVEKSITIACYLSTWFQVLYNTEIGGCLSYVYPGCYISDNIEDVSKKTLNMKSKCSRPLFFILLLDVSSCEWASVPNPRQSVKQMGCPIRIRVDTVAIRFF